MPEIDPELARAYARYGASARKRRAWSENPGNRAAWSELAGRVRALAAEQLGGTLPILDLGCGTGGWLWQLSQWVHVDRLHGIDALPDRLDAARQRVPGAHLHLADGRSLPFPDGTFGLILIFTVLGDIKDDEAIQRILAEANRALASGGQLLAYVLRMLNPFNRSTRSIRRRNIGLRASSETLTLLPPLARRLGRATPLLYPVLRAMPPLRSHRLWSYRKA